jgi:NAD(P)-dependent dehydrogenase (short-subunit alcohol dehydrogenase family)
MRLKNKVALIVGAGEHLGRAVPLLFAQEGASVVVAARRQAVLTETVRMIRGEGGTADYFCGSAVTQVGAEGMVQKTIEKFGKLDILYINIGGGWVELDHKLHELSEDAYESIVSSNLTAVYNATKAGVIQMLKQGQGGSIINVTASRVVRRMANPIYAYTKAGMVEMTRNLANDYHENGIRVNALEPGLFTYEPIKDPVVNTISTNLIRRQPKTARQGEPSDMAYAALYLASDESSFISGTVLPVDGGDEVKLTDLVLD